MKWYVCLLLARLLDGIPGCFSLLKVKFLIARNGKKEGKMNREGKKGKWGREEEKRNEYEQSLTVVTLVMIQPHKPMNICGNTKSRLAATNKLSTRYLQDIKQ